MPKIGFDPICYGTAVTAGGNGKGTTEFFYVSNDNVILTALTEILRNLCHGKCDTATRERQQNGGKVSARYSQGPL